MRAWTAWRERLLAEGGPQYADPSGPAFHGIDRHGHIHDGIGPDGVTRAITRISQRCGIDIRWTGHSLRSGLATEGRKNRRDAIAIARQGGWAPNSKSMLGYMRTADDWDDNASAGLA
ncbi:hypothetical protein ABIA33_007707 [Streptacidiphilus sp. MAP12-16]|uniref:hypothetical protein n=1 Tax=Streptacidiphilus sp. MAP12-16 TaxID=3156300 RepID=UPI0035150148